MNNTNTTKTTSQLVSEDLDIAYAYEEGETLPQAIETLQANAGVQLDFVVVNENGPGGGWPVVRFTGRQADIDRLIEFYQA